MIADAPLGASVILLRLNYLARTLPSPRVVRWRRPRRLSSLPCRLPAIWRFLPPARAGDSFCRGTAGDLGCSRRSRACESGQLAAISGRLGTLDPAVHRRFRGALRDVRVSEEQSHVRRDLRAAGGHPDRQRVFLQPTLPPWFWPALSPLVCIRPAVSGVQADLIAGSWLVAGAGRDCFRGIRRDSASRLWIQMVRGTGYLWLYTSTAVVAACVVGNSGRLLWRPMGRVTFSLVEGLLPLGRLRRNRRPGQDDHRDWQISG